MCTSILRPLSDIFIHSALCIELVKASLPSTEKLLSNPPREAERPPKAAAAVTVGGGRPCRRRRKKADRLSTVRPSVHPSNLVFYKRPTKGTGAYAAAACAASCYRSIYYGGGTVALAKLCCAEPSEAMKIWGNAGQA